jgi:hypothetical protein
MSVITDTFPAAWRPSSKPAAPRSLIAAKLTVGGLLAASVAVPVAGGFHGPALWLRLLVYSAGLILLPVTWWNRGDAAGYPLAADWFLLVPFAFDAAGNSLGLYGRVDNFDNIAHLVGTLALTGFVGSLLCGRTSEPLLAIAAAAGAATMLAVGIELAEWTAFAHPVATGYSAYRDTIGDLAMDVAGAGLGAISLLIFRKGFRASTGHLLERLCRPLLARIDERDRGGTAAHRAILGLDIDVGAWLGEPDRHPHVADVLSQPRRPDRVGDASHQAAVVVGRP